MIQPTAPTPLPAFCIPGEVADALLAQPGQGADFGALLALQVTIPAAEEATSLALRDATTPLTTTAALAATPGKTLPLILPEAATDLPSAEPAPVQPNPAAAALALRPVKANAKAVQAKPLPIEADPEAPAGKPKLPVELTPALQLLLAPPALLPSGLAISLAAPQQSAIGTEPETELPGQAVSHRTVPTLPLSANPKAQAQMLRHTLMTAPISAEPVLQPVQPQPVPPIQAVPPPTEEIRIDVALPRLAMPLASDRAEPRPLTKFPELVLPEPAPESSSTITAAPTAAQAGPSQPAAPVPQVRPHDFAALIVRIAVAREAAAPQSVSITVSHQDFGPVRLSFRPEDTGLSVAISNADPGFARAAAALPAPVLPVSSSEQASLGQQPRGDSGSAQTGGQSQSRGGSNDPRRDGQPQTQTNSVPHRQRDRAAARSGIFA